VETTVSTGIHISNTIATNTSYINTDTINSSSSNSSSNRSDRSSAVKRGHHLAAVTLL
jgi:hypothetical protein